jgi:hypothetical protein
MGNHCVCVCAGEAGRSDTVPVGRVHGVFGGLGAGSQTALCTLLHALGRIITRARHHVLLRHLRRHALLPREIQGKTHSRAFITRNSEILSEFVLISFSTHDAQKQQLPP